MGRGLAPPGHTPHAARPMAPIITFDASPWGGGCILWDNDTPLSHTHFTWAPSTLRILKTTTGDCRGQTAFEYMTLLMAAITFSKVLSETGALIKGDNLGALNEALKLKSTATSLNIISREVAWRKIVQRWSYSLEHLPAELNDEADRLSRLKAVPPRTISELIRTTATYTLPPRQCDRLWKALISYD